MTTIINCKFSAGRWNIG